MFIFLIHSSFFYVSETTIKIISINTNIASIFVKDVGRKPASQKTIGRKITLVINFSIERDEPYEITSENMFIEREQKTIGFSGNVILKQGSAYLTADQIELFFDNSFSQEGFYKMLASGNILIKNNASTSITGNLATYNVNDEKIIISENVVLKNQMSMIDCLHLLHFELLQ